MSDVVLITDDQAIRDAILTVAATHNVDMLVLSQDDAADHWLLAETVIVGSDVARKILDAGLSSRSRLYVTGFDAQHVSSLSVPLGAMVAVLPESIKWLPTILGKGPKRSSKSIAVLGGSGGVGCSTVAASLAVVAAKRGRVSALVDLDLIGGGLDLLVGAERVEGWRWPKFKGASGTVCDLIPMLPMIEGVGVVSMARGAHPVEKASVLSVLESLDRSADVVVMDVGRAQTAWSLEVVRRATDVLLVVNSRVRAVAAAREVTASFGAQHAKVLVRQLSRTGPEPKAVAKAVGLPLAGVLPNDRGLVGAAERGEPPGLARGAWTRACTQIVDRILR